MKPGGLGGHGGSSCFYYTLGSDPALWPAGERREGGLIMYDKGYYHSCLDSPLCVGYPGCLVWVFAGVRLPVPPLYSVSLLFSASYQHERRFYYL